MKDIIIFVNVFLLILNSAFNSASVYALDRVDIQPAANLSTNFINDLFVPEQYGIIEKTAAFTDSQQAKTIIIIQDAHCNYEAQHNIANIIETLVRDYGISLVAVEGAEGDLDLSRYGKYADGEAKAKAVDKYVRQGYVSGPEYLNITQYQQLPFGIYGIEDGRLYVKNYVSFRENLANAKETGTFIKQVTKVLQALKEKVYSEELLAFDQKQREYDKNEFSLMDWINYLKQWMKDEGKKNKF